MSGYTEDDIRRAADIREWLVKQIADKQDEVDRLRTTLSVIDSLLKQGSFRAAAAFSGSSSSSQARAPAATQSAPTARQAAATAPAAMAPQPSLPTMKMGDKDIRPLKRAKDEMMLANAEVTPASVVITPVQGMNLNSNTPPFRSFFLNRIVEGMKSKDATLVNQGSLKESDVLNYSVEEDAGNVIRKITINNYRDKDRLAEIFNTSSWVFTRMLEKGGQ